MFFNRPRMWVEAHFTGACYEDQTGTWREVTYPDSHSLSNGVWTRDKGAEKVGLAQDGHPPDDTIVFSNRPPTWIPASVKRKVMRKLYKARRAGDNITTRKALAWRDALRAGPNPPLLFG
jgi:hypothetical protein